MKKIILFTLLIFLCVCNILNIYALDYDVSICITNKNINNEWRILGFVKNDNELFLLLGTPTFRGKQLVKLDLADNKTTAIMDEEKLGEYEVEIFKSQNGIILKKSNVQEIIYEELDSSGNIVDSVSFKSQTISYIRFKGETYCLDDNIVYKLKNEEIEYICSLKEITGLKNIDYSNIYSTENTLWANAANAIDGDCKVINILDKKVLENDIRIEKIMENADKSITIIGEKYFPVPLNLTQGDKKSLVLRIDSAGNEKLETIQGTIWWDLAENYIDSDKTEWIVYATNDPLSIYKKSTDSTIIRYTLSESHGNNEDINIAFNDINLQFSQKPLIKNNRTLVPLRGFVAFMNSEVIWNNKEKSITLKKDSDTIRFVIGENTCIFNDKIMQIDTAPEIINNKTMIPIRIVSELFGYKVEWINNTVIIK